MTNFLALILLTLLCLGTCLLAFRLGLRWLMAAVATLYVLSNIVAAQVIAIQIPFFGNVIITSVAAPLYASLFLATDMAAERYGHAIARRLVWVGFASQLLLVAVGQVILMFEPLDPSLFNAHQQIFSFAPLLALASLLAYLVSQHLDIWLFQRIRLATQERLPILRNMLSTPISQGVDTFIVFAIAFSTIMDNWIEVMIYTYLVKLLVSIVDTPFFLLSRRISPKTNDNQDLIRL
ncbi:MAG: queuosine precursor transporter [Gammaproteobacteria bacterium]|nr:queuosine precursor transporter [Gammaproteobacteria bacterium]